MAMIVALGCTSAFTICPSEVASSPKVSEIVSGCVFMSAEKSALPVSTY